MYKKQVRLLERGYMINENENVAENEKKDINRHRRRDGHKYKMCLSLMMVIYIKQHLSNI